MGGLEGCLVGVLGNKGVVPVDMEQGWGRTGSSLSRVGTIQKPNMCRVHENVHFHSKDFFSFQFQVAR